MPWPIEGDYFEAVQHPSFCFADSDLRLGTLTLNALGLPKPITGAFASVYQISGSGRRWAVRCFLREFADQQQRYAAISSHLRAANLSMMVGFEYLQRGILVKGEWYPVLKMEWVDGEPLDRFVARHVGQPQALKTLTRQWIELIGALRNAQIAHGDLQHGNILVSNGNLRLIDYDGMYVPSFCGSPSHEMGHRNYQHPQRTGHDFNLELDNFSAWVIFHSLSALALEPHLWELLDGGDEHLLFRREDFQHPRSSQAFQAIERSGKPELRALAAHFRSLLLLPINQIPGLDGIVVNQPFAQALARTNAGIPEWLAEQVRRKSDEEPAPLLEGSVDESQNALTGATWLADHLLAGTPLTPILYNSKFRLERMLCGSMLLFVFIVATLMPYRVMSLWLSAGIVIVSPAGLIGLLFLRYRSFDLVTEKRNAAARYGAAQQTFLRTDRAIRGVNEDRLRVSRPLAQIDERYRGVPHALNRELSTLQDKSNSVLSDLREQRRVLEENKIAAVRYAVASAQIMLNQLIQQRNKVDSAEKVEILQSLEKLRRHHIEQVLSNTWLANADL